MEQRFNISDEQKKLAAKIIFGIAFFIIGYILFLKPPIEQIKAFQSASGNAKEVAALVSEIGHLKRQRVEFSKALGEEKDRHLILADISSLATKNGLVVDSIVPATIDDRGYVKLTLDMSASGPFNAIFNFFKAFEQSKTNIAVTSLSMSAKRVGNSWGSLAQGTQIAVTFQTYLKKGQS